MSTHLNVVLLSGLLPEHEGREERKPAQVDQSVEDTVLTEPLRHGVGLTRVAAAAVAAWKKYVSTSTYLHRSLSPLITYMLSSRRSSSMYLVSIQTSCNLS